MGNFSDKYSHLHVMYNRKRLRDDETHHVLILEQVDLVLHAVYRYRTSESKKQVSLIHVVLYRACIVSRHNKYPYLTVLYALIALFTPPSGGRFQSNAVFTLSFRVISRAKIYVFIPAAKICQAISPRSFMRISERHKN